jgi:hypothetical protein
MTTRAKELSSQPQLAGFGCGPRSKEGPGRKTNELSLNQKPREPSDCQEPTFVNQTVEGEGTLFQFGDFVSKSIVPHREIMNQRYNLKGVSSQSH